MTIEGFINDLPIMMTQEVTREDSIDDLSSVVTQP